MSELRTTTVPNLLAEAMDTPALRRAQVERERMLACMQPALRDQVLAAEAELERRTLGGSE